MPPAAQGAAWLIGRPVANTVPSDDTLWHPSAERLVASAMQVVPPDQLTGVLLTGMGHDGASATAESRGRSGRTIGEAQDSAVVFGMRAEHHGAAARTSCCRPSAWRRSSRPRPGGGAGACRSLSPDGRARRGSVHWTATMPRRGALRSRIAPRPPHARAARSGDG